MNFQKHSNLSKYSILVLVLASVLFLVACGSTPTLTINDKEDTQGEIIREGKFEDADASHQGSGDLRIRQNNVHFSNFSVTNGPGLVVLLVENVAGKNKSELGEFIELGDLRSTNGSHNYTIPTGIDLSKYDGVIIYCKPFGVVFSRAAFK